MSNGTNHAFIAVWAIAAAVLALLAGISGAVGYAIGQRKTEGGPEIRVSMPYFPDCDGTPSLGPAERNVTWAILNGEFEAAPIDSIPVLTATIIAGSAGPAANTFVRLEALKQYGEKAFAMLTDRELADLEKEINTLDSGQTSAKVLRALMVINRHDRESAAFMACVLRDTDRLNAFIQGRRIPLEEVATQGTSP